MEQMGASAGSADREMDIVTQSITFKLNALKETFVGIGQNLFPREVIGGVVDGFTVILEAIDTLTEKLGLFGSIGAGVGLATFIKNFSGIKTAVSDVVAIFSRLKGAGFSNITSVVATIQLAFSSLAKSIQISAVALGGFIAIAAGIAAIAGGVIAYNKHMENLRKSADESAKSFKTSNETLEDQASRVEELRAKLADTNTSEAEAYQIKSELLDIQNQLAESYGSEADGLDLVNGKLDDQIEKILSLNKAQAERFLTENHTGIKEAEKEYNADRTITGFDEKLNANVMGFLNGREGVEYQQMADRGYTIKFTGNADEVKQTIYDIMSDIRDTFGDQMPKEVEAFYSKLSDEYKEVGETIENTEDTLEQAKVAKVQTDETLYGLGDGQEMQRAIVWFRDYTAAINDYNKALASGDETKIQQAKIVFESLDGTLQQLTQGDMSEYRQQYEDLHKTLNEAAIKNKEFVDGLKGVGDSSSLKGYADALKELKMTETQFKDAFISKDTGAEGYDSMKQLLDTAVELGVVSDTTQGSVENLATTLVRSGVLVADTVSNVGQASNLTEESIKDFGTTAKESLDAVNAALASNNKATGLSVEEVENLSKAFKDVKGFDPEKLFIRTANGIKVSTQEIQRLNEQLKNDTLKKYNDDLIAKQKELADAKNIGADTSAIESEINLLQNLISQYEGATSAYQRWLDAQSGGEQGELYDSIQTAIKRGEELLKNDDVGTREFRAIADLFSYEDLSSAPVDKLVESFNAGLPVVKNFFKEGNEGLNNFLDYLENNNLADVFTNEAGEEMISFKNNVDEVAKSLGISSDLVTMIYQKLGDKGFDVSFLNEEEIEPAKHDIEELDAELDDLRKKSKVDVSANVDKGNVDELGSDIESINENSDIEIEATVEKHDIEDLGAELDDLRNKSKVTVESGGANLQNTNPVATFTVQGMTELQQCVDLYEKIKGNPTVDATINLTLDQAQLADAESLNSSLEAIKSNLPADATISIITDDTDAGLATAKAAKEYLSDKAEATVTINTVDQDGKLKALPGEIEALNNKPVNFVLGITDSQNVQSTLASTVETYSKENGFPVTFSLSMTGSTAEDVQGVGDALANIKPTYESSISVKKSEDVDTVLSTIVSDIEGTDATLSVKTGAVDDATVQGYKPPEIFLEIKAKIANEESIMGLSKQQIIDESLAMYNTGFGMPDVPITADNSQAKESVDEVESYAEGKTPEMPVDADTSQGEATIEAFKATEESNTVTVPVDGDVSGLSSAIDSVVSKGYSTTITAQVVTVGGGLGGNLMAMHAAGTFSALHNGTAYNMLNLVPAYANGRRVSIPRNENAIVNELGQEMLIRDGVASLIPGGVQMMNLKKGDIILNHKQTEAILNGQILPNHVRALASGTWNAYSDNNFYAKATGHRRIGYYSSGGGSSSSSSSDYSPSDYVKDVSNAMESSSDAIEEAGEEAKSVAEQFKDWLSGLFDWAEIKIERVQKRLDKFVSQAEKALNSRNYEKAISSYQKAISTATEQINNQVSAASMYEEKAQQILSQSGLDETTVAEIKVRVENGSMDISEYSDEIREVISAYKDWTEKAENAKDAIDSLHESILGYVDSIKEVANAQRDATADRASLYTDIGGGTYAFTSGAKYGQLRASDEGIRRTNDAYAKNATDIYSGLTNIRGTAINAIKSNKDTNSRYNNALGEARKCMNSGKRISDDIINTVYSRNPTMAIQLSAFNRALDNYETAQLEYITKVTENSALKSQNLNSRFENVDEELNNEISNIETLNQNSSLFASERNHNLDRIALRQGKLASNAQNRVTAFRNIEDASRAEITKRQSVKGVNYNRLNQHNRQNVNNTCQKAVDAAKAGKAIDGTTLTNLAQFAGSGLITSVFYQACVDYNNAVQYRIEAEQAAEIADATYKQQLAEIGAQKIANIQSEAESGRNEITRGQAVTKRNLAQRKANGEDVTAEEYQQSINENKQLYANYKEEARKLDAQIKANIKNKVWTTESKEYKEALQALSDVQDRANEAGTSIIEYSNKLDAMKFDAFDKAMEKLSGIKGLLESIIDLNDALGNYGNNDQYAQVSSNLREQAEIAHQRKRENDWRANKAKSTGTYQGMTYDQWMALGNAENAGKVTYRGKSYNEYKSASVSDETEWKKLLAALAKNEKERRELPFDEWDDQLSILDADVSLIMKDADLADLKGELVEATTLEQKRSNLLEEQRIRTQKIAELQKLIDGAQGEKERNEYIKRLKDEQTALKGVDAELLKTNQSITNLNFDKLQQAIELFDKVANAAQASIERSEAEGHYASEKDYDTLIGALKQSAESYDEDARRALEGKQKAEESSDGMFDGFTARQWNEKFIEASTNADNTWAKVAKTVKEAGEVSSTVISDTLSALESKSGRIKSEHNLKEQSGQYLTIQDYQEELLVQQQILAEQERLQAENQEKLEKAIAEGKEADANKYAKAVADGSQAIANTKSEIERLTDAIRDDFTDAIDRALESLGNYISELESTIDLKKEKGENTTEEEHKLSEAYTEQSKLQNKGATYLKEEANKERASGNTKKADELDSRATTYYTSSNRSAIEAHRIINSKSSESGSSSGEEDTIADKLKRELDILDAQYNILKTRQELLETQGEDLTSEDYRQRIEAINQRIAKNEELVKANMQLANSYKGDDKKAKEYLKAAKDAEAETLQLQIEVQNLGDEMRKTWITKDIDKVIDRLNVLQDALETISGFISEDMMYSEGQLTDYGITSLALLVKQYETGTQQLEQLVKKTEEYKAKYADGTDPFYSQKEFEEDMDKAISDIQKTASSTFSIQNKIVDMTIKNAKQQADAIAEVIDKRKQLLQSQKDYYNFDRTLKSKTNDLAMLEKQRSVLASLTDKESRAKLQQLNKQISEAREDIEETIKDHSIDLQISGLDDLKDSISKNLEDTSKAMKSNVDNIVAAVQEATQTISGSLGTVSTTVANILSSFGVSGLNAETIGYKNYTSVPKAKATIPVSSGSVYVSDLPIESTSISADIAQSIVKKAESEYTSFMAQSVVPTLEKIAKQNTVTVGDINNNYVINEATNPKAILDAILKNSRLVANTVSEEMLKNVSKVGMKKSWG